MAYDESTFEVLHPLTPEGRQVYQDFLEKKADEILFKHQHPLKWVVSKVLDLVGSSEQ